MSQRYNLRSRRHPGAPGVSPGASDGPSEAIAGDRVLNRRAFVRDESQQVTADSRGNAGPERDSRFLPDHGRLGISRSPPAQSASLGGRPETTRAGLPRRRLQWTTEMNKFLMRTFYSIVYREGGSGIYSEELREKFVEKFPNMQVSAQRVIDQKNAITRRNLLPRTVLDQIRSEVSLENTPQHRTENENEETDWQMRSDQTNQGTDEVLGINHNEHLDENENEGSRDLNGKLERSLLEFGGLDPTMRPRLPRLRDTQKLRGIIAILNDNILPSAVSTCHTLSDVHSLLYCAASTAIQEVGIVYPKDSTTKNKVVKKSGREEPWLRRLTGQIEELRGKIAILTHYNNGKRTRRLINKVNRILRASEEEERTVENVCDRLKQRLAAAVKRRKRIVRSHKRYKDNKLFKENEKVFYRKLENSCHLVDETNGSLSVDNAEFYWSSILGNDSDIDVSRKEWFVKLKESVGELSPMEPLAITLSDIKEVVTQLHNWKAPGCDGVHNYWIKKFSCLHGILAQCFNDMIKNAATLPSFMVQGITTLIHKGGDPTNPSMYRPITCLPTLWKIFTSCIAKSINAHCERNNIIDMAQNGCRRGTRGSKELLIMDMVIMDQIRNNKRNVHVAYVDYRKAYDSVPHSWLVDVLQLYRIHPEVITFLKAAMERWMTKLVLPCKRKSKLLRIKRGLFQGDSLSPLWFCLSINPLSRMLRDSGYGVELKGGPNVASVLISHSWYMDDLKLYARNARHLRNLIDIVKLFTESIKMEFGFDKCRELHIKKGCVTLCESTNSEDQFFQIMERGEQYRYLGIEQAAGVRHSELKEKFRNEFIRRLQLLLKTELNGRHLVKSINSYAISVLTYTFGILKWSQTDLEALERLIRTTMTKHGCHHPRASKERVCLPRKMGGRGIVCIQDLCRREVSNLRTYFYGQQNESEIHKVVVDADVGFSPLNLKVRDLDITTCTKQEREVLWASKALHGKYWNDLHEDGVEVEISCAWLTRGDLYAETEGFLVAIQDGVIPTRNYRKFILQQDIDDTCRRCSMTAESMDHILAGCPPLAPTLYLRRHNLVAAILHQRLAERTRLLKRREPYYLYEPRAVLEDEIWRIYWDRTISTDRHIPSNRPDIVVTNKKDKVTLLVDVAVTLESNMASTFAQKVGKYNDLANEIKALWQQQSVTVVPVVLSVRGIVPKSLIRSLDILGLPENLALELQKSVLLSCSSIARSFTE